METALIFIFVLLSYVLGSMSNAIWVGEVFYGKDIRVHGSGNSGAANTFRVLGIKPGIVVLSLDMLKGFTSANLVYFINSVEVGSTQFVNLQLLFGLTAVLGHLFPLFTKFKGGKGIATLFGVVMAIHWLSGLLSLGLFVLVLFLTRYVSLSSILACVFFPFAVAVIFKQEEPLFIAFGIAMALMALITHQKNIKRLLSGEENKANLIPKHKEL
mgnify:CR=1 FL=1